MKGLNPAQVQQVSHKYRSYYAWKCLMLILIILFSACQREKAKEPETVSKGIALKSDSTSDLRLEALKRSYEKKIDSLLSIQQQGNSQYQIEVAALTKKTEELEAYNKNLDGEIGRQANAITALQDSLQAVLDAQEPEENTFFTPVALTEASLDSLVSTTGPVLNSTAFESFDSTSMKQTFAQEVDSLLHEIDQSHSLVAEQDERLNGVLTDLAVAIKPKSTRTNTDYEGVIINALLSTVSDDSLLVKQYERGFYSKQDLNALVGDYKLRKTQNSTPGEIVIYRRKKKQDQQAAVLQIDGKSFNFPRNTIDTISVNNVFAVKVCDLKDHCETVAFSSNMTNYAEVSLRKNTETINVKPVNQVLGEFYARQVTSTIKKK